MKIVLLRHGKPIIPMLDIMKGSEFIHWINLYNSASLDHDHTPSNDSISIAKSCNAVFCSTLTRSIESADSLGIREKVTISSDFIEAGLPSFDLLNLKFSHSFWLLFFRISWFLGYAPNSESYSQAKSRATKCANELIDTARENESVGFIGHGILNNLISKELRNRGWQGPVKTNNQYWASSIYEKRP